MEISVRGRDLLVDFIVRIGILVQLKKKQVGKL